jgi:DNA polymerase-1
LLYEVLRLPVRLRNKATPGMRAQGVFEGTPSSSALAFSHALRFDVDVLGDEGVKLLQAVSAYRSVMTRFKMFYEPYANLPHWKDRKIHASQNQCATVTRRYSMSAPNLQQLPKGKKGNWRKVFVPHCKDGVILSLDFSGQELRVIADSSQDPNMLSCYVGDALRDMHSLTAVQIAQSEPGRESLTYHDFMAIYGDSAHPEHAWAVNLRKLAKTVNFATEYGAQAPKLAETLLVTEDEAQGYLDAKHRTFSRSEEWKREVIKQAHRLGYSTTRLGARRHLPALSGGAKWEVAGAERQAVNYVIQGSSAEMTKLAMARVWRSGVLFNYRAQFIAPIHDEMVFSVHRDDLIDFCREVHSLMVKPYADMRVPIESSISFGLNFAEQTEAGDSVDAERFRGILQQLFVEQEQEVLNG